MNWQITPLNVSSSIIKIIADIEKYIGRLEGVQFTKPSPKLRRKNRVLSVRGSTGIEGNRCSLKQVQDIAGGTPVALSKKDKLEISNALKAYDSLVQFDPFSIDSLLDAHKQLMGNGLMLAPGIFRQNPVEVYITETETMAMPNQEKVESMTINLFDYLNDEDELALLKSVRFHFEFVNIHPFSDGNGRTARLWQTRLLMEAHPVFEFLDVESMIFENREEYYRNIRNSQKLNDSAGFCLFMLEQILHSVKSVWENSDVIVTGCDHRISIARNVFSAKYFSRQEYRQLFKTISAATASRDLAKSVKAGVLIRRGDKRTSRYVFVCSS
jgi:Fic family protein